MNQYILVLTEDELLVITSQLSQLPMSQVKELFGKIDTQKQ